MLPEGKCAYNRGELELLWKLIRDYATLEPVRLLLQDLERPYSDPSAVLFEERILPEFTSPSGANGVRDALCRGLIQILRAHEEYGRQNVFFYCTSPKTARDLLEEQRVKAKLAGREPKTLLTQPLMVDKPPKPVLVDVRVENGKAPKSLTLKAVERRIYRRQVDQEVQDGQLVLTYHEEEERAVNVFQLHSNGLLELRIQSFRHAANYNQAQSDMWRLVGDLLPFESFRAVNLVPVRRRLWDHRSQLMGRVRFRMVRLLNTSGSVMTMASGQPDGDLASDSEAIRAVYTFLKHGGFIDQLNVYWLASDDGPLPARDVHMALAGQVNELMIFGRCSKESYGYVLDRLEVHCD